MNKNTAFSFFHSVVFLGLGLVGSSILKAETQLVPPTPKPSLTAGQATSTLQPTATAASTPATPSATTTTAQTATPVPQATTQTVQRATVTPAPKASATPHPLATATSTATTTATPTPKPSQEPPLLPAKTAEPIKTLSPVATPTALSCHGQIPIETFLSISSFNDPQASPNGGVYFLSDLRGLPQVFFLKSPKGWPEQVTSVPYGVAYYKLSPDGEKLLVASDPAGDEILDFWVLDTRTHASKPILNTPGLKVNSVRWSPTSDWLAYTASSKGKDDTSLYRFELKGEKSTLVAEIKGLNVVDDIAPNGKYISLTQKHSPSDSDILIWDVTAQKMVNFTRHLGEFRYLDGKFSASSRTLFLKSDVKDGILQVFAFTLANPEKASIMSAAKTEVEDYSLNSDRSAILFVHNEGGYSRFDAYRINPLGVKGRLLLTPNHSRSIVRSASFAPSRDGVGFFYVRTSSQQAPEVWYWNSPQDILWTQSSQSSVPQNCFAGEISVVYESFDKRRIPGFLLRPRGVDGPVPTIVYLHGGPDSQFRPTFSRILQYFIDRGFAVFAPNVRGSAGYGKPYMALDNYKGRQNSVLDVIEGAKWLIKNNQTIPGALALYGGSYGGYLALRTLQTDPKLFAVAAESVGITNLVTFIKNSQPIRRKFREAEYGPITDVAFLTEASPVTHVEETATPLLVFHGVDDNRVPVTESQLFVESLSKRKIPAEIRLLSDSPLERVSSAVDQAKLIVQFFQKHLKPIPKPIVIATPTMLPTLAIPVTSPSLPPHTLTPLPAPSRTPSAPATPAPVTTPSKMPTPAPTASPVPAASSAAKL